VYVDFIDSFTTGSPPSGQSEKHYSRRVSSQPSILLLAFLRA